MLDPVKLLRVNGGHRRIGIEFLIRHAHRKNERDDGQNVEYVSEVQSLACSPSFDQLAPVLLGCFLVRSSHHCRCGWIAGCSRTRRRDLRGRGVIRAILRSR